MCAVFSPRNNIHSWGCAHYIGVKNIRFFSADVVCSHFVLQVKQMYELLPLYNVKHIYRLLPLYYTLQQLYLNKINNVITIFNKIYYTIQWCCLYYKQFMMTIYCIMNINKLSDLENDLTFSIEIETVIFTQQHCERHYSTLHTLFLIDIR